MPQNLERIREEVCLLDALSTEVREFIYEADENDDYYDIIDAIDNLQDAITLLQIRQRWVLE